jgi:hypothetical protein
LNDQRRADVGAEHDRQRWDEIDEPARREGRHHQASRGTALEELGHADSGQQGEEPVAQRPAQQSPEFGPEGTHDPAADHP